MAAPRAPAVLALLLLGLAGLGEAGLRLAAWGGVEGAGVRWRADVPPLPDAAPAAAAQEVEVKHWFPDNLATNEFFPGKTVTCVLGVRNAGIAPVNVTLLTAQLASPIEATRNIFNFTSKARTRGGVEGQKGWRWAGARGPSSLPVRAPPPPP